MQQSLHGPSADGPKEKFPFLISLSRKASSFLQVKSSSYLRPRLWERERKQEGAEKRDERRASDDRKKVSSPGAQLNPLFFHLHLTQHWYRKFEKSLLPSNFLFYFHPRSHPCTPFFGPLLFPALWLLFLLLVNLVNCTSSNTLAAQNCDWIKRERERVEEKTWKAWG